MVRSIDLILQVSKLLNTYLYLYVYPFVIGTKLKY